MSAFFKTIFFSLSIFLLSLSVFAQGKKRFEGEVENMGLAVNSPFDELNPVFSPDGHTLYFTRSRHPQNIGGRNDLGDIWLSKKDEAGNWTPAENAGKNLNNAHFNSVLGFSPDGNTVYLHHHYFKRGLRPATQGLSFATKQKKGWSEPQKLNIENFYNQSQHQSACISPDGKVMILAINSYGSYGYEDLYVSYKVADGTWSAPKNMGSTLNTMNQEMTPFISKDNTTLYFASSGHNTRGSRDIFASKKLDNSWRVWSKPENISELNSEGIELGFVIDPEQKFAYFISTQNSDGYGDINKIKLNQDFQAVDSTAVIAMDMTEPDTVIIISQNDNINANINAALKDIEPAKSIETYRVKGGVFSKKSELPINAKVSLIPVVQNQDYRPLAIEVENGKYAFELDKGIQYKLKVSAEGFLTMEEKLEEEGVYEGTLEQNFYLTPLEQGATFQINNVLFERGTASLVDSSYAELDNIVEMMSENPALKIEIGGHTDNQGDARLNLKLSEQRVETVISYMMKKGIQKSRIVGKGYGGTNPISSNRSEITRKLNRRVEFTILETE